MRRYVSVSIKESGGPKTIASNMKMTINQKCMPFVTGMNRAEFFIKEHHKIYRKERMMSIIKYVETTNRLRFLEPTLQTRVNRLEKLCRSCPQSTERYYFEPALVALLAGSAWSNDIQAITEVKVKRLNGDGNMNDGRLDLLMISGGQQVALEAKIVWDWVLIPEHMEDMLKTACAEAASIQGDIAEIRMGIVFFVPWWNDEKQRGDLSDSVIQNLSKVTADLKAYCWNHELSYPGAILLGKLAGNI